MEAFVRSRWQSNPQGKGYFWLPGEPQVVNKIEENTELVTDHSCTMVLWGEYEYWKTRHYLYLTGLDSGYSDQYHRPIKNTILWKADILWWKPEQDDMHLRNIMIEFLDNRLQKELLSYIQPDNRNGFTVKEKEITQICKGRHQCEFKTIGEYPREFENTTEIKNYLLEYRLPAFTKYCRKAPNGLFAAIGRELSLDRMKHHNFLRFVFDTLKSK